MTKKKEDMIKAVKDNNSKWNLDIEDDSIGGIPSILISKYGLEPFLKYIGDKID